jgi:hypothetical protein
MTAPLGFDDRDVAPRYPRIHPSTRLLMTLAVITAVTIISTAVVVGGRYTAVRPAQGLFIFTVDRFTGATRLCGPQGCRDLRLGDKDPWGVAAKPDQP